MVCLLKMSNLIDGVTIGSSTVLDSTRFGTVTIRDNCSGASQWRRSCGQHLAIRVARAVHRLTERVCVRLRHVRDGAASRNRILHST